MNSSSTKGVLVSLIGLDARRLVRDGRCVSILAVIFVSSLLGSVQGLSLSPLAVLFVPLLVGWSWGRDIESGSLVPISLTVGRFRILGSRFLVLLAVSLLAITPAFIHEDAISGILLVESTLAGLILGFLCVTATRSSHAGWFPLFLLLVGVLLPSLQMMRASPGFRPPLWLWLLASFLSAPWSAAMSPERISWTPWVLVAEMTLVASLTALIFAIRPNPLSGRS